MSFTYVWLCQIQKDSVFFKKSVIDSLEPVFTLFLAV